MCTIHPILERQCRFLIPPPQIRISYLSNASPVRSRARLELDAWWVLLYPVIIQTQDWLKLWESRCLSMSNHGCCMQPLSRLFYDNCWKVHTHKMWFGWGIKLSDMTRKCKVDNQLFDKFVRAKLTALTRKFIKKFLKRIGWEWDRSDGGGIGDYFWRI